MAVSKVSTQLTQGNEIYYNRGAKTNEVPNYLTQKQDITVGVKIPTLVPKPLTVLSFFITMAFDFEDLLFQLEEAENGNELLEAIDAYVEGVA